MSADKQRITVALPKKMVEGVDVIAQQEERSRSKAIELLIRAGMDAYGNATKHPIQAQVEKEMEEEMQNNLPYVSIPLSHSTVFGKTKGPPPKKEAKDSA